MEARIYNLDNTSILSHVTNDIKMILSSLRITASFSSTGVIEQFPMEEHFGVTTQDLSCFRTLIWVFTQQ